MFDEILQMVKDHMANNPEVSAAIPPEQADAIHEEIANHVTNAVQAQAAAPQAGGGLLSSLEGALTSNSPIVNAVEGGIVGSLGSKFGLSSATTGAIAAALPGLIQRYTAKQ